METLAFRGAWGLKACLLAWYEIMAACLGEGVRIFGSEQGHGDGPGKGIDSGTCWYLGFSITCSEMSIHGFSELRKTFHTLNLQ